MEDIAKDLEINDFNIKEQQMRLPGRKHFWAARLMDAKRKKYALITHKRNTKETLIKGIIAESAVRITSSTAGQAAEQTDKMKDINDKIRENDFIIEYLDSTMKIFNSLTWDIKNLVELVKLEQL